MKPTGNQFPVSATLARLQASGGGEVSRISPKKTRVATRSHDARMIRQPVSRVAIFGLGVVGSRLARLLEQEGHDILGFSRSSSIGRGTRLDASNERESREFSKNLPSLDALFVTFPPQQAHPCFLKITRDLAQNRFLLGSTGIYRRQNSGERITEQTALKPGHARLVSESEFIESGGTVVRLSGIYGEQRNPIRWILDERVGYENRQVNLVHYDDIARALSLMLGTPRLAPVYNLSDGQPHSWRGIIDFLVEQGWLEQSRVPIPPKRAHSFVENGLFLEQFPNFSFRNFWEEIAKLANLILS